MEKATKLMAVLVLVAAAAAHGDAPAKPSSEAVQVSSLADAKWVPSTAPGIVPGVMVSPVSGDAQTGPAVRYIKFPAGYAFPSHWHSVTEYGVVVAGKPRYTIAGKTYDLAPGSYVVIPAETHHQVNCGAESELLNRWSGPLDFHFDK